MNIGIIVHTVIVNNEEKFLLIKRASHVKVYPNLWDIPGGTLKAGEDPTEGAIRETKEESGLVIDDLKLFTYTSNIDKKKNKQFIKLIFKASHKSGEVMLDSKEHESYRWIDISEVDNYDTVYYLADVLKKLEQS